MLHFTLGFGKRVITNALLCKAGVSNIRPRNQKQPGKDLNLADGTAMININLVF